jgi:hypothetical protein
MNKTTPKTSAKPNAPTTPETEQEDDDIIFEDSEFSSLSDGIEQETIKRDARRKIEIYWEKKRLKEQFEDFDESEFGF